MPIRTLFLSLLVLLSTAFPGQAFRLSMTWRPPARPRQIAQNQANVIQRTDDARGDLRAMPSVKPRIRPDLGFALSVLTVAGLAIAVSPVENLFRLPVSSDFYLYAAGFGLLAPFAEYVVGLIAMWRMAPLRLHERAGTGWLAVPAVLVAAVAEEMVFRGIFMPVLSQLIPVYVALGVTAVVYGLNHLYFGWLAVLQKTLTGVGFGVLFVLSGYSVLVPIAAHAAQNLVVQMLPRRAR